MLDNGAVNVEFAVTYRGQPWTSISVDVARAEAGESEVEWVNTIALTEAFGVTGPVQLPRLPLRFLDLIPPHWQEPFTQLADEVQLVEKNVAAAFAFLFQ